MTSVASDATGQTGMASRLPALQDAGLVGKSGRRPESAASVEHTDALLAELIRGAAPNHVLLLEGFHKWEIRHARTRIAVERSLDRNSHTVASRPTVTPATRDGGASGRPITTTSLHRGEARS